jgi:lipopolysaccharide transport system ATP-binding protein
MSNIVLEMVEVSKKFKRGELYDSLRDLIPAFWSGLLKRRAESALGRKEFWALREVSFQVNRGEALGIIGSNGAGKSTILKLLSGIMKPTVGQVMVNGTLSALIEVGAGFHPDLTGRENVFLNGTILGMKRDRIKQKFDEIVEFSGLGDFIDTPVKRYSSGMYARLGFSVAAHVDPDILLVDEVLSVGDYLFQNKCLEKMKAVIGSGATVIFISHNLRAVTEMCSRCILLDHGMVVKEGASSEVVQEYLDLGKSGSGSVADKEAYISGTVFHDGDGRNLQFSSGQKARFEVNVTGQRKCKNLSVTMILVDSHYYHVFDTSTDRLNHDAFTLEEGETKKVTFDLALHLAPGTYHVGALVYRWDIEKIYDRVSHAATIYITSDFDNIRGIVNLYPKAQIERTVEPSSLLRGP